MSETVAVADSTAIVVTHNSAGQITHCLAALERADLPVIVVDNASTDKTVDIVATQFPTATLLANEINVGFSAAVNQALDAARTDFVLLVNPDCLLPSSTAQALVDLLRGDQTIGVVGPRLRGSDGRVAISTHPFDTLAFLVSSRFGGDLVPVKLRRLLCRTRRRKHYDACLSPGLPVFVDWVSGACMAVRTHLLRQIGGLDESYFMYYEDEELCLQAWRHGARVCYVPMAEAVHIGGASSSDPSWIWPHLYRSLFRFHARHRPQSYFTVRALVLLRALLGVAFPVERWRGKDAAACRRAWRTVARIAFTAGTSTVTG